MLNLILSLKDRLSAGSHPRIETLHLPRQVDRQVRAWLSGNRPNVETHGDGSVLIPHPESGDLKLKIKGGSVEERAREGSGPIAPRFDFDGRMMPDVASGSGAAPRGISFQQAAIEYRMSQRLAALGYDVVPCLGFGRITRDGETSWFSVFELGADWNLDAVRPERDIDLYIRANRLSGQQMLDLATHHNLIGYHWFAAAPEGRLILKDVHPFLRADPVLMSQLSWVMQVYFTFHIRAEATGALIKDAGLDEKYPEIQVECLRPLLPSVTAQEFEALRQPLVRNHMTAPPADFLPERLYNLLMSNRITAALMAICPPRFTRFPAP